MLTFCTQFTVHCFVQSLCSSHKFITTYTNFLVEYINYLKIFLKKECCNVNFSNFKNFLQRKQKTGRTREYISIFRASGSTNFENFSKFGCRCGFDGFTNLPNVIYIYILYIYIYYIYIYICMYLYIYKLWVIEYSNV